MPPRTQKPANTCARGSRRATRFIPATLSVFQRKWQALPQFQQTRGTLAMLAQWIAWAHEDGFKRARTEPLITLGSAPLDISEFGSVVLSQLGEARLAAAIDSDVAGTQAHARALDADTTGPLRDIHRRAGTTMLFESSGGQIDKVAHLPELRFALGEPAVDTTSIDTAARALEERAYFIRRVGTDGFRFGYRPTIKKVVNDRRAALDEDDEIRPAMRKLVKDDFDRGATIPRVYFPTDAAAIADTPRLTLVVLDPDAEWTGSADDIRARIARWTRARGASDRLYPGALVWTIRKPGRELRDKAEQWLAWKRVADEAATGALGSEIENADLADIRTKVKEASEAAREEVWAGYRFVVLADAEAEDGLATIDLGAGHSSSSESLCGRIVSALKSDALLNESVGASYLERNWPPALKESGRWPLASLRQSFLNGSLTRLLEPDKVLRQKIIEFVEKGEFGLGSGRRQDGGLNRVWFKETVEPDDVAFESDVHLVTRATAQQLKAPPAPVVATTPTPEPGATGADTASQDPKAGHENQAKPDPGRGPEPTDRKSVRIHGQIEPGLWNRIGRTLVPKLRSIDGLKVGMTFELTADAQLTDTLLTDVRQILDDLQLGDSVNIDIR